MADRLDFEIDVELETGLVTGNAGVPVSVAPAAPEDDYAPGARRLIAG